MTTVIDRPRHTRWTWIVAVLLLLWLLWAWWTGRGPAADCCATPAAAPPVATTAQTDPPANATVAPPATSAGAAAGAAVAAAAGALGFNNENGKWALTGTVPDQATRERLFADAEAKFGLGNVVDRLSVQAGAAASPCSVKSQEIFAWLERSGGASIACGDDGGVTLTGTVPSEQIKQEHGQWAQRIFSPASVTNNLEVLEIAATADDVQCGDRIGATVTFATGSAQIGAQAHELLDAVAGCLGEGSYEVAGHTDNVGSDAINDPLSQRRADTVREYLIGKGVDGARLTAKGYGSKRSIANNDTENGRAQNRRIEFHRH